MPSLPRPSPPSLELPFPDQFGNYWFHDGKGRTVGPAIFPSKIVKGGVAVHTDRWFVSFGVKDGMMCDGDGALVKFKSPAAALKAMRRAIR